MLDSGWGKVQTSDEDLLQYILNIYQVFALVASVAHTFMSAILVFANTSAKLLYLISNEILCKESPREGDIHKLNIKVIIEKLDNVILAYFYIINHQILAP